MTTRIARQTALSEYVILDAERKFAKEKEKYQKRAEKFARKIKEEKK